MIETASQQLAELLDELSLAARIEGGRYDPKLESVDTGELAAAAAERLGAERVGVSGEGRSSRSTRRRPSARCRLWCSARSGTAGSTTSTSSPTDQELRVSPITPASAPVVLGEDLRDLGAAVAVMHVAGASAARWPWRARR